MKKGPTKNELRNRVLELSEQVSLDRINLHNKLNEPPRKHNETVFAYRERLKKKQFTIGYSENDYVIL